MVLGTTLAALNAFSISRGIGRPLAQKVRARVLYGAEGSWAACLPCTNFRRIITDSVCCFLGHQQALGFILVSLLRGFP